MPESKRNLKSVMKILSKMKTGENGFDFSIFLRHLNYAIGSNNFVSEQFNCAFVSARTTASCILSSLLTVVLAYMDESVQELLDSDELQFNHFMDEKNVLFITLPDMDTSRNKIAEFLLNDLIRVLIEKADESDTGRLSRDVRFFLDDFGTYRIKDFPIIMANARSRGLSFILMLQSLSQLEKNYEEFNAKTILECCDRIVFLGGNEARTIEFLSEITFMKKSALALLSFGSCVYWQRGHESKIVPVMDCSLEKEFCIGSYKHISRVVKKEAWLPYSDFTNYKETRKRLKRSVNGSNFIQQL